MSLEGPNFMVTIRLERPVDEAAREALLDTAYGPVRHQKPSARLRRGRLPADGLCLVAIERGRMVGTVRLWPIHAGRKRPALLLGPLAVHPQARNRGIGSALMRRALDAASCHGHDAVLLVGDESYYGRFGFSAEKTAALTLTGADPARLLACELKPGALDGAHGRIGASGARVPIPALAAFGPLAGQHAAGLVPHAA
jgi:predicted N-acetyltransferase YhbS